MVKGTVYAVFSEDVAQSDKYRVPNFCRIKKYSSKKKAEAIANKTYGDKVYSLSRQLVWRKCRRR